MSVLYLSLTVADTYKPFCKKLYQIKIKNWCNFGSYKYTFMYNLAELWTNQNYHRTRKWANSLFSLRTLDQGDLTCTTLHPLVICSFRFYPCKLERKKMKVRRSVRKKYCGWKQLVTLIHGWLGVMIDKNTDHRNNARVAQFVSGLFLNLCERFFEKVQRRT